MARISYIDPDGTIREVKVTSALSIGRHPQQDVQILDRVVSKAHAKIEKRANKFYIKDAGSRNGTSLNGNLLAGEHQLTDKDDIMVGSTHITFFMEERPDALTSRVTILEEEHVQSAIRSRVRNKGRETFLRAEQIDDDVELRKNYEKLRIANELNQAISMEFDANKLLNVILKKAIELFKADRGVIMLTNSETGELEPAAMHVRLEQTSGGKNVNISRTILREVVEERTGILSSDATLDTRFSGAHSIMLAGIKATMSVPLLYRDTLHGVIHLDSQLLAGAFTERDLALLSGFAGQAAKAIEHANLVETQKREFAAREQLRRLMPADLVDQVMNGQQEIVRSGDLREVSVLFADIRGFTSMSERYPPKEIVNMLNEYFEIMVEIIFEFEGTLDKFVGDEIMAVWGAPIHSEQHCIRAVRAGLKMQLAIHELNLTRIEEGNLPIYMGIGINSGEAVAGYMGSSKAMDYTVIGDTVNVAARLCGVADGGDVVVSTPVLNRIGPLIRVEQLPSKPLKGKSGNIPLFSVKSCD